MGFSQAFRQQIQIARNFSTITIMSGEVVKMFFLKWLPENEKNYQNRFWHSRHDNCNAMSLQKPRNAQKHS